MVDEDLTRRLEIIDEYLGIGEVLRTKAQGTEVVIIDKTLERLRSRKDFYVNPSVQQPKSLIQVLHDLEFEEARCVSDLRSALQNLSEGLVLQIIERPEILYCSVIDTIKNKYAD